MNSDVPGLFGHRAVPEGRKRVRNPNRNEPSRGHSPLHGQDVGKTREAVLNNRWRLAAVGCWWQLAEGLAVVGGSRWLAVGGPWGLSSRAVLKQKKQI